MNMTDQVREAIRNCGMSRYRLAKLSGVTAGGLSRIMAGDRDMTLTFVDRIAPFIGVRLVVDRPKPTSKGCK